MKCGLKRSRPAGRSIGLGLLCFAAASFVRIIICDYPGCEDGRAQTMLTYHAVGALLGVLGGYLLIRGKRHRGD